MNIYTTRTARPALPRKKCSMNAASREALATMTPEELAQRAREAGFGRSIVAKAVATERKATAAKKFQDEVLAQMQLGISYPSGEMCDRFEHKTTKEVVGALTLLRKAGFVESETSGFSNQVTRWCRVK